MRNITLAMGIALILAATGGSAWADGTPTTSNGPASSTSTSTTARSDFEIKVGLFTPYGSSGNPFLPVTEGASSIGQSVQFSVGLEYEYFLRDYGLGSAISLSADSMPIQRNFLALQPNGTLLSSSQQQNNYPVLANYKYYWQSGSNARTYGGVGLGQMLGDYGGLAWTAFLGTDLGNVDLEMRYIGNSGGTTVQGSQLDGIYGFDIGYKFH